MLAFLLFSLPFAYALVLSWHPSLGILRRSMLNPLLLFSGYIVLVACDFASMDITRTGHLAGRPVMASGMGLLEVKYAAMLLAALAGMNLVLALTKTAAPPLKKKTDIRLFVTGLYALIFALWLWLLLQYSKGHLSLAGAAEVRAESAWDANLFLLSMLLVPGLSYFLPRQPYKVAIPVVAASIVLLAFSGSRARILYVLIPFAFYFVMVRGIRLPRMLFAVMVVILGFLAIAAVNYRVMTGSGRVVNFSELATTSNIFNLNDIAFAETNLALSRLPRRQVEEFAGQDLVGFALADIPRSAVHVKPLAGSNQFTATFDKRNWRLFRRGLTIGGISEVEYDYPFPLALVVIFLFGAAWAWGFVKALASPTIHGFAWTIAGYVMLYSFLKADMQSAAQLLWAFVLYTLVVKGRQMLITRSPQGGNSGPRRGGIPAPLARRA